MPTIFTHVPTPTTPASYRDGSDFAQNHHWQLMKGIEDSSLSKIQGARDSKQAQLMKGIISQATQEYLDLEYEQAMNKIEGLPEERYQLELMKEIKEHLWGATVQMLPTFLNEEQNMMNTITDNSARIASERPTDEQHSCEFPPSPSGLERDRDRERGHPSRPYTYVSALSGNIPIPQHSSWARSLTNPSTLAPSSSCPDGVLQRLKDEKMTHKEEAGGFAEARHLKEKVQRMDEKASKKAEEDGSREMTEGVRKLSLEAKRWEIEVNIEDGATGMKQGKLQENEVNMMGQLGKIAHNANTEENILTLEEQLQKFLEGQGESFSLDAYRTGIPESDWATRRQSDFGRDREKREKLHGEQKTTNPEIQLRSTGKSELQIKERLVALLLSELNGKETWARKEEGFKRKEAERLWEKSQRKEEERSVAKWREYDACTPRVENERESNPRDQEHQRRRCSGPSNADSNRNWSTTTKLITTPSQSTSQSISSIPSTLGKPANGSVSSSAYHSGAFPLAASSLSKRNRARRHAEFHSEQQERLCHEQKRIHTEFQMRVAGKHPTREEFVNAPTPTIDDLYPSPLRHVYFASRSPPGVTIPQIPQMPVVPANPLPLKRNKRATHSLGRESLIGNPIRSTSNSNIVPPPSVAFVPSRSISQKGSPPSITPPCSASSAIGVTPKGPLSLQREAPRSQPVDAPFTIQKFAREDEAESLTHSANQAVLPPYQNSWHSTAPWIITSGKPHMPKKPMDAQFMARMANLRRQTKDTSSHTSSPDSSPPKPISFILGSRSPSVASSVSESASIASQPPVVPPAVFTDVTPSESLLRTATRSFDIPHGVAGPSNSITSKSDLTPGHHPRKLPKLPAPPSSARRGYWNRRGDHLTPDGYIVFPPPTMQYPEELKFYPLENRGYQDHTGLFVAYVRRPELPQSLPKHGKPPERPYESFISYV